MPSLAIGSIQNHCALKMPIDLKNTSSSVSRRTDDNLARARREASGEAVRTFHFGGGGSLDLVVESAQ